MCLGRATRKGKAGKNNNGKNKSGVDLPDGGLHGIAGVPGVHGIRVDDEPARPLLAAGAGRGEVAVRPAGRSDGRAHRHRARRLRNKLFPTIHLYQLIGKFTR